MTDNNHHLETVARLTDEISDLCRDVPPRAVLNALISAMLNHIIKVARDEHQAARVVAEASRNLLSQQEAVAERWRALRHRIN